jgi:glycosyltransferase involved in cell wall biosynthesis
VSKIRYQFEGPFDSSYSLAIVNREMARAVEALHPGSVALHSTEGPGDFPPNLQGLRGDTTIIECWERSQSVTTAAPTVTLRNLYPPRVTGMSGKLRVMNNYAWEESVFPAEYVAQFNQHLDLVTVTSEFVRKTLVDSGVNIPVVTIGNGVDHILRYPVEPVVIPAGKGFCFLHISSCFPRKGVDVLLDAYTTAFTAQDDVVLIIKTFPNPHHAIERQINALQQRKPDCPAIHLINEDLTIGQINSLYQQADALVMPSRGEGFGMPMAEAMLWNVPVIATGHGGHTDFCTAATSWLVDYQLARSATHVGQFDSLWAEPNVLHLISLMRGLYEQSQHEAGRAIIQQKTAAAKRHIEQGWYWQHVAQHLLIAVDVIQPGSSTDPTTRRLAWVSTWNTRCGIASYSEFLLQQFHLPVTVLANNDCTLVGEDADNVIRCWSTTGSRMSASLNSLLNAILDGCYTDVVIQFNFGFFHLDLLKAMLDELQQRGIAVYMVFHATQDILKDGHVVKSLRQLGSSAQGCKRLFVHGVEDVNRLKRFGWVNNVSLIPHGVTYWQGLAETSPVSPTVFRIATYGFLLPGKGIPELIAAFVLLKARLAATVGQNYSPVRLELFNALYSVAVSEQVLRQCERLINVSGYADDICLHTAYQDNDQALQALAACDLVVFPYQQTRESASGAVRMGVASGKPVVCSPLDIFNDVADIVHFLPDITPQGIADGLFHLVTDAALRAAKHQQQQAWLKAHDWKRVVGRLESVILDADYTIGN